MFNSDKRFNVVCVDLNFCDFKCFFETDLAIAIRVEVLDHVGLEVRVLEDDVVLAVVYLALKGLDGVSGISLISGDDIKVLKEQQEAGLQASEDANTQESPVTNDGTADATEETETVTTETE